MSRKKIAGWLVPSFLVFVPLVAFLVSGQWRKELVTEYEQTPTARSPRTAEEGSSPAQGETPPPDDTVKKLVRTWNQGKVENIASLFAADGTLIIPTGTSIQSRSEIEKLIAEKGLLKETTLINTVAEIALPEADTAIIKATYHIEA